MVEQRNRVRALVELAQAKVVSLEVASPTRRVATESWFADIAAAHPPERAPDYLPPLLLHLARLSVEQLRAFDADLELVQKRSPFPARTGAFIADGAQIGHGSSRQWYAGRAELAVLAHLTEHVNPAALRIEPQLPSGKLVDAAVRVGDRWIWLECSALTTSNADLASFNPAETVTVGTHDPYIDARRMYRKIYDKVIGEGDAPKSRLHPTEPTMLLIVDGVFGPGQDSLGYTWALQQILDPDRREAASGASLTRWIDHDYPSDPKGALAALADLSGIATHGYDLRHRDFLRNTAANDNHTLTDVEAAAFTALLQIDRIWTRDPDSG